VPVTQITKQNMIADNLISDEVKSQNYCPEHSSNERGRLSCDKTDDLFIKIISFENLLSAWRKTEKLRRYRSDIILYRNNLDENLFNLQKELKNGTYKVSEYRKHFVFEPKKREISVLPIRDRVVQHALNNIIEPLIDKRFIFDSHACRKGHGVKLAVDRALKFAKKNQYVLKCDISKYYPSINQEILFDLIKNYINCEKTLNLIKTIIKSFDAGLPIGNLTSQFFANLYLHELDFFAKIKLSKKYYIRYMDDFLIFSNSVEELKKDFIEIENFLTNLKLKIHEKKRTIYNIDKIPFPFLGSKIYKTHTVLLQTTIRKNRRKIKKLANKLILNKIEPQKFINYFESVLSHSYYSRNYSYRKSLWESIRV
jgi:RNA-directed DNA polymerase